MLGYFDMDDPNVTGFHRFLARRCDKLVKMRIVRMDEISMGTESGDDWTLDRINKGYHAHDILEQCAKLDEAGIRHWHFRRKSNQELCRFL